MKTIKELKKELSLSMPMSEKSTFRLYKQEKKEFEKDAKKEGLSLSEWFRLSGKIKLELNKEKR